MARRSPVSGYRKDDCDCHCVSTQEPCWMGPNRSVSSFSLVSTSPYHTRGLEGPLCSQGENPSICTNCSQLRTTTQTEGWWRRSSGTSALGNKAEQGQDHRAKTEDSDLPSHQHMWWESWHLKRNGPFFLEEDLLDTMITDLLEPCGFRKGGLFSRAQVWRDSCNFTVSFLWGFSGRGVSPPDSEW